MSDFRQNSDAAVLNSPTQMQADTSKSIKVGFVAPLTGPAMSWGKPGFQGCQIWSSWVNKAGGAVINGVKHRIEFISHNCQYDPARALNYAHKLVQEDGVEFVMTLGGDGHWMMQEFLNQQKILTSTLGLSDLSPDMPYLIAPCEVHPVYLIAGIEWLAKNKPRLKKVATCAQKDTEGLSSLAVCRAACEVASLDVVKEVFFPVNETDYASIVSAMMSAKPDILCWNSALGPTIQGLTEAAFHQGFTGQILAINIDEYQKMIELTSQGFMEGCVFHFPDFDDPALEGEGINFNRPREFFETYNRLFPGQWNAVSWEYVAILEMWKSAVEEAGTTNSDRVLAAMKRDGFGKHVFGQAKWCGRDLFGINNTLVGNWPVVQIQNGKAKIVEFRSVLDWWTRNGKVLEKHMRSLGQMWDQHI